MLVTFSDSKNSLIFCSSPLQWPSQIVYAVFFFHISRLWDRKFQHNCWSKIGGPDHSVKPFFIKIKKGTYQKYIRVDKKKTNIVLIGEGMDTTIIMGNRSFVDSNKTYDTATVWVLGNGFTAAKT
ncbi:hypothetical protein MTR67_040313 [Solanum verrucosum]|uniref:Pectinesterase catalytic domain-containing protein n=1 Tax=Solanum verrucosum TaxID=315347 RepID=A0AAF0UID5_SOLVR|nr:hypothetical protein MTR67_040313 [Solanum verrucosum]